MTLPPLLPLTLLLLARAYKSSAGAAHTCCSLPIIAVSFRGSPCRSIYHGARAQRSGGTQGFSAPHPREHGAREHRIPSGWVPLSPIPFGSLLPGKEEGAVMMLKANSCMSNVANGQVWRERRGH